MTYLLLSILTVDEAIYAFIYSELLRCLEQSDPASVVDPPDPASVVDPPDPPAAATKSLVSPSTASTDWAKARHNTAWSLFPDLDLRPQVESWSTTNPPLHNQYDEALKQYKQNCSEEKRTTQTKDFHHADPIKKKMRLQ